MLLRMRGQFGLRGAFHGYPSIDVLLNARCYTLSMVNFFLALEYCQGRCFEPLVAFSSFFFKQNPKTKIELHPDIPFSCDCKSGSPIILEACISLLNVYQHYIDEN